jgi:hypothetical protein
LIKNNNNNNLNKHSRNRSTNIHNKSGATFESLFERTPLWETKNKIIPKKNIQSVNFLSPLFHTRIDYAPPKKEKIYEKSTAGTTRDKRSTSILDITEGRKLLKDQEIKK